MAACFLVSPASKAATTAAPAPGPPPADIQPAPETGGTLKLHERFVTQAQKGGLNVVFFGDSSTTCWQTTGRDIWNKDIAPLRAADFGIYGDDAHHLLWRLRNGELEGYRAKAIVMMIGAANLLRGAPADRVAAAVTACAEEIRRRQPQAKLLLFVPPHISIPFLLPADYTARALATAQALKRLDNGGSIQILDMTDALQARRWEALIQVAAARDPHKSHVEFEVWWNALQKPLAGLFWKPLPAGIPSRTPSL